jgi:hypothetical protein
MAAACKRFHTLDILNSLLAQSHDCRYRDVGRGYELARLAAVVAAHLGADARGRAYCVLSNAARLTGRFAEARRTLDEGFRIADHCDLPTLARLHETEASLLDSLRDPEPAARAAWRAVAIRRDLGDQGALARALIQAAIFEGYSGRPSTAVRTLNAALPLVEPSAKRLAVSALHSLSCNLLECGELDGALAVLAKARMLVNPGAEPLVDLRLCWLQGRLAQARGDRLTAESELRSAELGFMKSGMTYEAALVGLDLGELFALQERKNDLAALVGRLETIFSALGVETDALAMRLLAASLGSDRSAELLRSASEALRAHST